MRSVWSLLGVIVLCFCVQTAFAGQYSVAGVDDDAVVKDFVLKLKGIVEKNDAAAFAQILSYPLTVRSDNGVVATVKNEKQAVQKYSVMVNAKVKQAVLSQDPDTLFANYQGIMIGDGEIWLSPDEHGLLKIIAINQ
ncbi:hypothetical protein [Desulfovibrio inopinatus]|uniref:hypothetical protein n=1 Tax=Desulfovibrio inopinatus TaxID=102109 RepID=UPI000686C0BD|nr:hypothetical protein [Desulfovibrio inopinatus]